LSPRRALYASVSNTAAAGLGAATSLALTIFVAHRLGLIVLGEYAVIATVYSVFGVVDVARSQDLTTRYASGGGNESRRVRVLVGAGGLALAIGGALAYGALTDARAAEGALVAWTGAVVQIMTAEAVASTQVNHRFQRLAMATAAGSVVGSAVAAGLLERYGLLALGIGLFTTSALTRVILFAHPDVRNQVRARPTASDQVRGQAVSLSLLGGAAQLVNFTDVVSIRTLATAAQVGVYRAGSQIPTVLVGLLYRGFDTVMPQLAAASEDDAAYLIRKTAPRLGVIVGAAMGLIIGLRRPLVRAVLGHGNHDAQTVLWLFATVWLINSIVHPAALLLIARRRQGSIVRLIGLEYAANLVLTIALVPSFGAVGSAVATLVTLGASNLLLLPRILARELPSLPMARHLLLDCVVPSAIAAAVVIAGTAIATA
jgi:O-antigen/teichoic acid export membrane protein